MPAKKAVNVTDQKDSLKKPASKRKAKAKPTADEMLKKLDAAKAELVKFRADLEGDYNKIKSMNLKMIDDLVKDANLGIDEDLKEIEEEKEDITQSLTVINISDASK